MYCKSTGKTIVGAFSKVGSRLKFKYIATSTSDAVFVLDSPVFSDRGRAGYHLVYVTPDDSVQATQSTDISKIFSPYTGTVKLHSFTSATSTIFARVGWKPIPNYYSSTSSLGYGSIATKNPCEIKFLFKMDASKCIANDFLLLTHDDCTINAQPIPIATLLSNKYIIHLGDNYYMTTSDFSVTIKAAQRLNCDYRYA